MTCVTTTLYSATPRSLDPVTRCHILEFNTYYDPEGERILTQWILWDFHGFGELLVVDYILDKVDGNKDRRYPTRVGDDLHLHIHWRGQMYHIIAESYRETHTLIDPEINNRKWWHRDIRRGLNKRTLERDDDLPVVEIP